MTAPQPSEDRPEVSVIVSVLNGERFIGDISEYLMNQTFEDVEVIFIISSKCVDASLERARESASGMGRAKVFEYPDTGELGGSKNYGKDRASGRCLWFLDVDDRPSLHFLEEMVAVRRRCKAQVVGCNFIYSSERTPFEVPAIKTHFAPFVAAADTPIERPVHANALPNSNKESPKFD